MEKDMQNIEQYVTNCYADMQMVDFLLENVPDFYTHLIIRHHKFVESYAQYKGSIKMVAAVHGYADTDMKRIFWRIQKKLLLAFIDLAYKGRLKISETPETFDSFLMWQLEQFREDASAVYTHIKSKLVYNFNIDGISEKRREQVKFVLEILSTADDLSVLPDNAYPLAIDLLDGMALTKVVEKHKKNLNYVVTSIIGRNNPRSKAERGWLAYLENEVSTKREIKIIQFPLR